MRSSLRSPLRLRKCRILRRNNFSAAWVSMGNPLSVGIPKASRDKAVSVGVRLQKRTKCLRDTNDARSSVFVARSFAHELLYGLVGESCEIGEQLAVSHEEGPQHFGQGESP